MPSVSIGFNAGPHAVRRWQTHAAGGGPVSLQKTRETRISVAQSERTWAQADPTAALLLLELPQTGHAVLPLWATTTSL